jgi:Kef-type K+ transport system membrane component KefB
MSLDLLAAELTREEARSLVLVFAAGVIVGLVLDSPEGKVVRIRLEGIGFGFLVPIYFVVTGMTFDIDSLGIHVQLPANSTTAVAIKPTGPVLLQRDGPP